jgi:hypothetical protein
MRLRQNIPMNMTIPRIRLAAILALLCLALMSASPIAAAPGGNGNGGNNGNAGGNGNGNAFGHDDILATPSVAATPELDSLALFGTGASVMVGYALMRLRAGRRQDNGTD